MNIEELELSIASIDSEINQNQVNHTRLVEMSSTNLHTRGDVIDLEQISGESFITDEYPIAMFPNSATSTGSELIGEGIFSEIVKVVKKGAALVWSIITKILMGIVGVLGKLYSAVTSSNKPVYNGSYGDGKKVSFADARVAVIERIIKENPSVLASQFLSSTMTIGAFDTLITGFPPYMVAISNLMGDFNDYVDEVNKTTMSLIANPDKIWALLEQAEQLLFVDEDFENGGVVGKLAPLASRASLGVSIKEIRRLIPSSVGAFDTAFPDLKKVTRKISKGDLPAAAYFGALDKELGQLKKEKSSKVASSYNYSMIKTIIDAYEVVAKKLEEGTDDFNTLAAAVSSRAVVYEDTLENLAILSTMVSPEEVATHNVIKRLRETLNSGLLECRTNLGGAMKLFSTVSKYVVIVGKVKGELELHSDLEEK